MIPSADITVCILHYRKLPQLKRTVSDLLQHTQSSLYIKILNQGYVDDEIRAYLSEIDKRENVEVIYNDNNIGCSPGRNVLTRKITTPYVMILDDDMYVNKDWDIPVMQYFKEHSDIGAIGFSIYRINGEFWFTGGQNIEIHGHEVRMKRTNIDPSTTSQAFLKTDDVCAGAMIYRSELAYAIPWDENYFIGFEDLEKGIYLKKHGVQCAVSVQSKFIHDKVSIQNTNKEYNKSRRNYHAMREAYLHFLKKNDLRMDVKRHIFYKYICRLPNTIVSRLAATFLRLKRV